MREAMTTSKQSWALVGPGAIGLYYGGLLAKSGVPMHVLGRSDTQTLADKGITIRMMDPRSGELLSAETIVPAQVVDSAEVIGAVDCVLIAAKTTFNEALVESLRVLVAPGRTIILSLQNGMGNAEFFMKHFPTNPVLAALCFVCVNRTASGVVENYLPGRVEIGSLKPEWQPLAEAATETFEVAGITCATSPSLERALWRKLCWNVPFNGLSIAAGGITTDKILADPDLKERARLLMEEVRAAAKCYGHEISDKFLLGQFDVTEKMGAYRPSSLIDYLDGRAVEVESLWGEPLRRGQAKGVAMPELERLYARVQECLA